MPIKKKSTTKQLTIKFDDVKKVDNTLEALEDEEIKRIVNLSEKVEKKMKINDDDNHPSNDDDIFEFTSSTVDGQSPSTSNLSGSSFASRD